jgi:hypothetical protein
MLTKIKEETLPSRRVQKGIDRAPWYPDGQPGYYGRNFPASSNRIEYGVGPKHAFGHCNWKPCTHTKSATTDGLFGIIFWEEKSRPSVNYTGWLQANPADFGTTIPSGTWDSEVIEDIISQINLNCSESIMCYSGVLQAIPLVGGAFKFTSIMNRAAKKLSKSFKKQPFTTVVKQLIQGDFINRFVVGPMIQDAKMFNDACDYVLRVMNTAYERNAAPTALQASRTKLLSSDSGSYYDKIGVGYCWADYTRKRSLTSKAFARVDLSYDVRAISPIKLWATRCGITRPLDSVWDLVPFSFVIDYFTRAGDFISGLSDKMSAQGGLEGKITQIHDLWGSFTASDVYEFKGTTTSDIGTRYNYWYQPSVQRISSARFTRFPISDPGSFLNSLESSNPLFQDSISLTKLRTIAELIIQAKL